MRAIDSTDLIAGHPSHRSSNRNPARQRRRPAGRDQSRASGGPRHALGGSPPLSADRADGSSFQQLSGTGDSAPARLRGRGDVLPAPAAASGGQIGGGRTKPTGTRTSTGR